MGTGCLNRRCVTTAGTPVLLSHVLSPADPMVLPLAATCFLAQVCYQPTTIAVCLSSRNDTVPSSVSVC